MQNGSVGQTILALLFMNVTGRGRKMSQNHVAKNTIGNPAQQLSNRSGVLMFTRPEKETDAVGGGQAPLAV